MRLVWNSFLSPPSSDRAKEPFQPLFFCFNRRAYGTAVVLDENATETQLARILRSKLPPLRCVREDWYLYREGVWSKTSRDEFKPLALSIQDERTRTAKKTVEILKHVEFSSQTSGKE